MNDIIYAILPDENMLTIGFRIPYSCIMKPRHRAFFEIKQKFLQI